MTILTNRKTTLNLATLLAQGETVSVADWIDATSGNRQRARELRALEPTLLRQFFRANDPAEFGDLLADLDRDTRRDILEELNEDDLAALLAAADLYDARDVLTLVPRETAQELLSGLPGGTELALRELLAWPEDSIGAAMYPEVPGFPANSTIGEIIEQLRAEPLDTELGTEVYLLEADGSCAGKLDYRNLLAADPATRAFELARQRMLLIPAELRDEDAANDLLDAGEASAPVVHEGKLVGVLTQDRAHQILQAETTEDVAMQAATTRPTPSYQNAGVWLMYRSRVFWLILLVFGNLFSGAGIAHYEDLIEQMVVLVFFLPLLIDSGGNAGSQSSTLMVRALATGDVGFGDWWRMIRREILVALLLGVSMGAAVSILGAVRGGPEVALVVALTMVLVVLAGSVIGMLLPIVLTKFKLDPAAASAPLITSICDGLGVLIYFGVASALLL